MGKSHPGRGGHKVDEEKLKLIKDLAALQMPLTAISALTGISERTLIRRFAGIIREGREKAKASIAQVLLQMAVEKKDKKVLMYLGDRLLYRRQHDKDAIDTDTNTDIEETTPIPERVKYKLNWADESEPTEQGDDGDTRVAPTK